MRGTRLTTLERNTMERGDLENKTESKIRERSVVRREHLSIPDVFEYS